MVDWAKQRASVRRAFGEDLEVEVGGVRAALQAVFLAPTGPALGGVVERPAPALHCVEPDAWAELGAGPGDFVIRGGSEASAGERYRIVDVSAPDAGGGLAVALAKEGD